MRTHARPAARSMRAVAVPAVIALALLAMVILTGCDTGPKYDGPPLNGHSHPQGEEWGKKLFYTAAVSAVAGLAYMIARPRRRQPDRR